MDPKFLKELFGISELPKISFSLEDISLKAQDMANAKLSISGLQPKLSLKLDKHLKELVIPPTGGEYIFKPQTPSFPHIPENENCCMDIAQAFGIDVPPHCLLALKDKSLAYVVKRFDRKDGQKIHQEDFFQALEKKEKYNGSVEQIGKKLKEISAVPGLDVQLFYERVVFNFLIGNGDAHFKNYSIVHLDDGQKRLSPAYDIVCTRLVIKDDESALMINGKNNKLGRKDFDALADYFKIPEKIRYEKFEKKFDVMKKIIESSYIDKEKQKRFIDIVKERTARLQLSL